MRRKLGSVVRNQSVCRQGEGPHKNNAKGLDWKRNSRIYEWTLLLQRGVWYSDVQREEKANIPGPDLVSTFSVTGTVQQWQNISVGTLKLFTQWLESCSLGTHDHLALRLKLHLLVWIKTRSSKQSPRVSLRQRGSIIPRMNSDCFLCLSISFLIFPASLYWGFIWLAFTTGFILGCDFSAVSWEWLTCLVSGSVLDISVVWNCSSRSKNGVCAIVNLITEWKNIISFIGGGVFFSFKWGPNVEGYWTNIAFMDGAYN